MYGTQAPVKAFHSVILFENDVNMYGTQACKRHVSFTVMFENDVNMYGTQAKYPDMMSGK